MEKYDRFDQNNDDFFVFYARLIKKGEEMALKEREDGILVYLGKHKEATVRELCEALFVSEATMRRDLARLHASGKIVRTYGGAALKNEPGENLPLFLREREHSDAKAVIGRKCLSLISDGDVIMVDGSSTAQALLRLIGTKRSVVVITNSAKAPFLVEEGQVKLFVTGGELAIGTYTFVGNEAETFLRGFSADLCFFSVRTLTAGGELTDNALSENAVRRVMLERSKKRVLMLDSQKIGAPCLGTLCTLNDIDFVVCEKDIGGLFAAYRHKFI